MTHFGRVSGGVDLLSPRAGSGVQPGDTFTVDDARTREPTSQGLGFI